MEQVEEGNRDLPSSPKRNKVGLGSWVCTIIGLGFIGVVIWFFVAHTYPVCYINKLDIFALKHTTNSSHYNNTIHFDVVVQNNRVWDMGVYYDALNLTFYYKHNLGSSLIGDANVNPFYQRRFHWHTHRRGYFEARGVAWENVTTPVMFRVELATATRFNKVLWKTKRHHMVVGADIRVNDGGNLVKRTKLKSNAIKINKSPFKLVGILVMLLLVHS